MTAKVVDGTGDILDATLTDSGLQMAGKLPNLQRIRSEVEGSRCLCGSKVLEPQAVPAIPRRCQFVKAKK